MPYEIVPYKYKGESFLSLEILAVKTSLHPDLIMCFVDYGLLEPYISERQIHFTPEAILRLRRIIRLREELGVSLPGINIILDLTERISFLQKQVAQLQNF